MNVEWKVREVKRGGERGREERGREEREERGMGVRKDEMNH